MAPGMSAVKREHDDDDLSDSGDDSDDYGGEASGHVMDYSVTSPGYSSDSGGASNRAGFSGSAPRRATGPRKPRSGAPLTPEEQERRRLRRERNKFAAAKCRQKRVDLTNTLLEETQSLEAEQQRLQEEIKSYQQEKEELEFILEAHRLHCGVDTTALPTGSEPISVAPEHHAVAPSYALPVLKVEGSNEPVILQIAQTATGPKISALQPATSQVVSAASLSGLVTAGDLGEETVIVSMANGTKVQVMHKRPSTLGTNVKSVKQVRNAAINPADAVNVFTIGLDSMIDGHTGLTPITGMPAAVPLLATPSGVLTTGLASSLTEAQLSLPENLSSKVVSVASTRSMVTL